MEGKEDGWGNAGAGRNAWGLMVSSRPRFLILTVAKRPSFFSIQPSLSPVAFNRLFEVIAFCSTALAASITLAIRPTHSLQRPCNQRRGLEALALSTRTLTPARWTAG